MLTTCISPSMNRISSKALHASAIALGVGLLSSGVACTHALAEPSPPAKPTHSAPAWLERPWEIQYFVFITDNWDADYRSSLRFYEKEPNRAFQSWEHLFQPTHTFQTKDDYPETYTTVVIEFDKNGFVQTPNTSPKLLRGRLDVYLNMSLATGTPDERNHYIGDWFMGWGDESTSWAPSLCESSEVPAPLSDTNEYYKYGPAFEPSITFPTFGCREWAYQLRDPDRPYIDITSYFIPKTLDPDGPGTYVRQTTFGWFGFDMPLKPVIGKQKDKWYCFFACPDGQAPGLIPNIGVWATQHGWPTPTPPQHMPMFPDPPQSDMEEDSDVDD